MLARSCDRLLEGSAIAQAETLYGTHSDLNFGFDRGNREPTIREEDFGHWIEANARQQQLRQQALLGCTANAYQVN
jgi:hypothetical protein